MSTVPNGSESFGTIPNSPTRGRPPVLSDEQLLELAHALQSRLGRPPKSDELITAAGGCQRQRALTTLRTLAQSLARKSVRGQLVFPSSIEDGLRELMQRWMDAAAEQLAERHAEMVSACDEKANQLGAYVEELTTQIQRLADELRQVEAQRRDATDKAEQLAAELIRAKDDSLRNATLADERARLLAELKPTLLTQAGVIKPDRKETTHAS